MSLEQETPPEAPEPQEHQAPNEPPDRIEGTDAKGDGKAAADPGSREARGNLSPAAESPGTESREPRSTEARTPEPRDYIPPEIAGKPTDSSTIEFRQPVTKDEAARVLFIDGETPNGVNLTAPDDAASSTNWTISGLTNETVTELRGVLTELFITGGSYTSTVPPDGDVPSGRSSKAPAEQDPPSTSEKAEPPPSEQTEPAANPSPDTKQPGQRGDNRRGDDKPNSSSRKPDSATETGTGTDSTPSGDAADKPEQTHDPGRSDSNLAAAYDAMRTAVDTMLETFLGALGEPGGETTTVGPRSPADLAAARDALASTYGPLLVGADQQRTHELSEQFERADGALVNQYVRNSAAEMGPYMAPTITGVHARGNEIWATVHGTTRVPQWEGSPFGIIGSRLVGHTDVPTQDDVRLYKFDDHTGTLQRRTLFERQAVQSVDVDPTDLISLPKLGAAAIGALGRRLTGAATKIAGKAGGTLADDAAQTALTKAGAGHVDDVGVAAAKTGVGDAATRLPASSLPVFTSNQSFADATRNSLLGMRASGQPSRLDFLLTPDGQWRTGTIVSARTGQPLTGRYALSDPDQPIVQVGHLQARAYAQVAGKPEYRMLEDADLNWLSGAAETRGAYTAKPAVLIDGTPVDIPTAKLYEGHGLLPPGTIDSAPLIEPPPF